MIMADEIDRVVTSRPEELSCALIEVAVISSFYTMLVVDLRTPLS